ncbi:hypothetical protein ACVI1I_001994 [Bradyrhizobium sp. USDA 4459]
MASQGLAVIGGIVAEHGAAFVQSAAVAHQHVPKVMSDLVAEMPEQRAIRLAHFEPAPLALDGIGLGQRDRDQAVVMAGHDPLATVRIVGEEIEEQAVLRVVLPGLDRQLPADQGIEQPVLRHLQLAPTGQLRGVGEIGHDAVVAAGTAIAGGIAGIRQPVASIILGIAAQHPPLALVGQRGPALPIRLDRRHCLLLRQEGDPVTAALASAVLEIENVAAVLADEELQDLASRGEFLSLSDMALSRYARRRLVVPKFGTNCQTRRSFMPATPAYSL